jgi:hypothetical protein
VLRVGVIGKGVFPGSQAAELRAEVSTLVEARELENLRFALAAYRVTNGAYPNDLREMVTAGLVTQEATEDRQGQPYSYYRTDDGSYTMASASPASAASPATPTSP